MTKHQVVVAYDFSKYADLALQHAVDLACREPEHTLHFITVIESGQNYQTADEVQRDLLAQLRKIFDARNPDAHIEFFVHVRIGKPVEEILGLAEEIGADLVICGSHGRGVMGRLLIGSVSAAVLHGARCPVLVVRVKEYPYVALDKVVEVPPSGIRRAPPHRYSYQGSDILTRPNEWPLG